MLKRLTIRNYALIKALEMEPASDLNVITGETGAGKSIMLGAIGLLTGNRADTRLLWDEKQKCVIEGTFDIRPYGLTVIFQEEDLDYDDITLIRREISPGGKSRAFINDTPVTLDVMKRIGNRLLDIHSQHENLLSGQQEFQLALIDAYAGNQALKKAYAEAWNLFWQSRKAYETLKKEGETLRKDQDYLNFQLDELVRIQLEDLDQVTLESRLRLMDNAEEIKGKMYEALQILGRNDLSTRSSLAEARNYVSAIANFNQSYGEVQRRLNSLLIELDDIIGELEHIEESIDFDPQEAVLVREKLDELYRLQKKHGVDDVAGEGCVINCAI